MMMKLLLENWRKFLTEATLPGDASMIAVNPQDYVEWSTDLTNDLQSYIAFKQTYSPISICKGSYN